MAVNLITRLRRIRGAPLIESTSHRGRRLTRRARVCVCATRAASAGAGHVGASARDSYRRVTLSRTSEDNAFAATAGVRIGSPYIIVYGGDDARVNRPLHSRALSLSLFRHTQPRLSSRARPSLVGGATLRRIIFIARTRAHAITIRDGVIYEPGRNSDAALFCSPDLKS